MHAKLLAATNSPAKNLAARGNLNSLDSARAAVLLSDEYPWRRSISNDRLFINGCVKQARIPMLRCAFAGELEF